MKKNDRAPTGDAVRSWVSLGIVIHLFTVTVALAANYSASELQRRVHNVLAPYSVAAHQDYGGVALEMTRGQEIDFQHLIEIHRSGTAEDIWVSTEPATSFALVDRRWPNFERMIAFAAADGNEELVHLLFRKAIERRRERNLTTDSEEIAPEPERGPSIDAIRLRRRTALSESADQAWQAGELPQASLDDKTLFECRVVELDSGEIRLLPVLESTRTAKSLLKDAAEARP